jgi:hypothetical protein
MATGMWSRPALLPSKQPGQACGPAAATRCLAATCARCWAGCRGLRHMGSGQ